MRKTKRFLAVALAATMVIGSSVTAFADDNHSSTGTGSNEGHVDKHVISVTLPTVPDGSTPFNYTIDPERLVTATSGSRYTNEFTNDAKTNGVYFLTGGEAQAATYEEVDKTETTAPETGTTYYTKSGDDYVEAEDLTAWDDDTTYYVQTSAGSAGTAKYDSKSDALVTTSESSADIELTVEVAAANDGNVTLVNAAPSLDEATENAQLYLALMVGTDATVIKAGEKVSKTVTIAGVDSNFTTTYNSTSNKYEYTVIDSPAAWGTASFYLTGVASKSDAENVTAPTLTVTWKYEDPAATPTIALSNATANTTDDGVDFNATFTRGTALTCAFTGLGDDVTLSTVTWGTSVSDMTSTTTNVPLDGASFTINSNMWGSANAGDVRYIKLTASNGTIKVVKVTIA